MKSSINQVISKLFTDMPEIFEVKFASWHLRRVTRSG